MTLRLRPYVHASDARAKKHHVSEFLLHYTLCGTQHKVNTAVSVNDVAELTDGQSKCCFFEWALHLSTAECAQIATRTRRRAVAGK